MNPMISFNAKGEKYKKGSHCSLGKGGNNFIDFRLATLLLIVLVIAGLIIVRLYFLQVFSNEYYEELAGNQHYIFKNLVPKRGEIFLKDKEGFYPVAVNKEVKMAYAVPKEIEDVRDASRKVSEILEIDERELEERFSKPDDMYEPLKHRLSEEEMQKIKDLKLEGIHLADESFRYYPAGELASQILGFVGWKNKELGGRYGIENYFNEELEGKKGELFQNKDNSGGWITTGAKNITPAKNGDTLVLTIDHIIQYETEKIIKSAVEKFEGERGTIIVMEPETGKIKAMASYPNFDPNDYKNQDMKNFRNLAVSDAYECGSVFKPILMAAALDDKKVNPSTTYTDTGRVTEAGYVMQNSDLKSYGLQTMTEVLEKSLNTGVIYAQKLLGNKNFFEYIKRFGFGEITNIDLPGESGGNISNLKNLNRDINFFTASFGQGITVTPIQLVSAYNAMANGGMLMKPQIIEEIIHSNGEREKIEPVEIRKVISQEASNQISEMLFSVVEEGHGKRAGVPGYRVAGKTGTAQVASSSEKGYEEGKNIGSFAGYAPVDNPKFTVLVRIDDPKAVEWAESSAAPAFGELMKFLLEYENIKPTEEYSQADINEFKTYHTLGEYFIKNVDKENKDEDNEDEKNEKDDN